ncbi:uncharacterized protein TM35_000032400 [Trypanosoma theileri]|uniref:Uncharacterized protein n=1 Tax=Trypanosoma theileri TaxID=67003 RepID=A0A1X0P6C5_9TRYP|nr:uncharacterized protein TM35_000032400 [Trypanosoma theileri]ORC92487.1 hypothetical protein TM35_000032400 [Trypanosoma theileri]
MSNDTEPSTLLAHLSQLPATEHAILLNRFKFLNLVQRVAAADVAEMIQNVGLDVLLCKGALENIPPPLTFPMQGPTTTAGGGGGGGVRGMEHPTTLASTQRRMNRRGHTTAMDTSTGTPRRRRFATREEESKFIQRMAKPPKRRDIFAHLREPVREHHEHNRMHRRAESPSSSIPLPYKKHFPGHEWEDREGNVIYHDDLNNSDVVMIDSSDDRYHSSGFGAVNTGQVREHTASPPQGRGHRPIPRVMARPKEVSDQDYATHTDRRQQQQQQQLSNTGEETHSPTEALHMLPAINASGEAINHCSDASPVTHHLETSHIAPAEASSSRGMFASTTRSRGAFAPKAKPKAAADVPRVPMEVIRHASALLAAKTSAAVPPPAPPPPQERLPTPRAIPQIGSSETPSIHYNSATSQSYSQSMLPPELRSGRKMDSELQRGQSFTVPSKTLSDEALMEVASCVERMLQDHRSILDSIVKEEQSPPPDSPKIIRRVEKGGRGGVADDMDSSKLNKKKLEMQSIAVNTTSETPISRIVQHAHDILEDISDEDDELLLVSRLQRQVGAMDRELEAIEERDLHHNDLSEEEEEKERVLSASVLTKRPERRVTIADPKEVIEAVGTKRKLSQGGHRRRGEIPRAIVERLRSFQKENHEYIHYTEKQWNTSNVTEQVFAQRLTDTLVDDAFQEVFQEVGDILDEYVEGLAQHELQ